MELLAALAPGRGDRLACRSADVDCRAEPAAVATFGPQRHCRTPAVNPEMCADLGDSVTRFAEVDGPDHDATASARCAGPQGVRATALDAGPHSAPPRIAAECGV